MAAFQKFNAFVADIHNKIHALNSDTIKVMLTNTAPVATNAVKTDISEISAGNGYSAGGTALSGVSSSQTSGTYTFNASNITVVTATGSVGPFRYAVIYNSTAASGNLIGWYDYGSSITLANTETFTITFSGGIFTCT
jgi:hypothetical protein